MGYTKDFGRLCCRRGLLSLALGLLSVSGFIGSCDDRLIALTRYFEPCGTVFGNCLPGEFETRRADVGDFCIDPACTVPGQCPDQGQPLGTITDICP